MELAMENGFCEMSQDEMELVDGGGWNECLKAFSGSVLVAGGVVLMAVPIPGAPVAGLGVAALGASGIASCAK